MNDEHLFVYGTLRRDADSDMHRLLAASSEFVGRATFQGKLYRIDWYPGVVPSDDPSDLAQGEVRRLRDPDAVLARLDQYEQCGPGFPEPTEYVRRIEQVRLASGALIAAWIYLYNWPVDQIERVPSGDFLDLGDDESD